MGSDFSAIRKWFSGKALTVVDSYVLPTLAEAEAQGYWPKGASRKVCAALNKQAVSAKFARANERNYDDRRRADDLGKVCSGLLDDVMDNRREWYKATLKAHELIHGMMFGYVRTTELVTLCAKLAKLCSCMEESAALAKAAEWAADFAPVGELVELLDSRRPPRVVVMGTLSRTVAQNFCGGLGLDVSTIRCPPQEVEWYWTIDKQGREVQRQRVRILWPEGTQFSKGRFRSHDHCQACGHAIKNPFNWVPVLIDNADDGVPHAFWIGNDCARNLCGATVEGEGEYVNRDEGAAEVRS